MAGKTKRKQYEGGIKKVSIGRYSLLFCIKLFADGFKHSFVDFLNV